MFALGHGLLKRLGWAGPKPFLKTYGSDQRPREVAEYIRRFAEGTEGEWDWDDFENMRLDDPALEAIRHEVVMAGPPKADIQKIKACLAKVEALVA